MSEDNQDGPAGGMVDLLILVWGLAPAIAMVVCLELSELLGPKSVGLFAAFLIFFSPISQYMWSQRLVDRQNPPASRPESEAALITVIGLAVNCALVFGGCMCMIPCVK